MAPSYSGPITDSVVTDATHLTRRFALRSGDAIHLATALQAQREVPSELVFVTSDKELVAAARASGLDVLDPRDVGSLRRLNQWRTP